MPGMDADRWNKRYRQDFFSRQQPPRSLLVDYSGVLPESGLCLDIATGTGSNAQYLLNQGLRVIGVDISFAGLTIAKQRSPTLDCLLADMTQVEFPARVFDVILNFYYLQRDLLSRYCTWLKPGGMLFFETLTTGMLEIKPDIQPDFLLNPGELKASFQDWEILHYSEDWVPSDHGREKAVASLVARNLV